MKTSDQPTLQDFHIEGVQHIRPDEALALLVKNEAVLIDVREPDEVKNEHIPLESVLYHPMSVILDRIPYIAKDQNIILGCPGGVRSSKIANLLNLHGFPNVANLDGGFMTWKAMGLPFKSNLAFSAGCGCGCNISDPGGKKPDGACC